MSRAWRSAGPELLFHRKAERGLTFRVRVTMPSASLQEWRTTRQSALDELARAHASVGGLVEDVAMPRNRSTRRTPCCFLPSFRAIAGRSTSSVPIILSEALCPRRGGLSFRTHLHKISN